VIGGGDALHLHDAGAHGLAFLFRLARVQAGLEAVAVAERRTALS
jgi:hypothetical protein